MTFLLLLAAAALINGAIGGELRIKSVDEFIKFKDNVNNGTNYEETTVFLDSDLSLYGETLEPIGNSNFSYFLGVFNGQGHVISNLSMNSSSSQYAGLFGYSRGLSIKNVILDSSCSITSSFSESGYAYIGGIIGECNPIDGPCTIENSVNMGSVAFSGNVSDKYLYIGGTVGSFTSSYHSNYESIVKNCANYGDVTDSGESGYSFIGGIAGLSSGFSSKRVHIYNSLNHGTVTHNGTTTNYLRLGGITGYTECTTIENCVSGGKISLLTNASSGNFIGSIVGQVFYGTTINYTYFTNDLSGYNTYGYEQEVPSESYTLSYDSTTFKLNGTASIGSYSGTSLIDVLNTAADYHTLRDYSHWLLNKGNNAVSFTINGRTNPIKMDYQIILLPSLASEGNMSFDGWYIDDELTAPLTKYEVTSEAELYGSFCSLSNFTVTLDANGGDELQSRPTAIVCNDIYLILPAPTRTGHTFLGWFTAGTDGDKIESGDEVAIFINHTLYAHWSINNYTVTFDPSGGIASQSTKVVTFGSAYGDLPNVTRNEHTFLGWFTEKNESITNESIVIIADNHTLFAHWLEVTQGQVEIVFSTKDMTNEEIEKIIKKYTDADFKITVIESTTDEIRVIVEFVDTEKAESFIETVRNSSKGKTLIKRVGFIQEGTISFSPAYHPMNLLWLI